MVFAREIIGNDLAKDMNQDGGEESGRGVRGVGWCNGTTDHWQSKEGGLKEEIEGGLEEGRKCLRWQWGACIEGLVEAGGRG